MNRKMGGYNGVVCQPDLELQEWVLEVCLHTPVAVYFPCMFYFLRLEFEQLLNGLLAHCANINWDESVVYTLWCDCYVARGFIALRVRH